MSGYPYLTTFGVCAERRQTMNEPKTTDEEWERLMALLNKEVREAGQN
jgi:hypothetical protein